MNSLCSPREAVTHDAIRGSLLYNGAMITRRTVLRSLSVPVLSGYATARSEPRRFRIGVVGLVHGHIGGFFDAALKRPDVELVGLVEDNDALAKRVIEEHGLAGPLRFKTVEDLIQKGRPEAIAIYSNTFDHAAIVKTAAAHNVHVIMEKPLAVSRGQGQEISLAAKRGKIHVLVNYETTWYPSNGAVWNVAKTKGELGQIRKMVAHHGHSGPKEIGVGAEFLAWLTDPEKNGGGALYDFGCYGANLMTWLMDGHRPTSVTAVVQRNKPQNYPRVDDEATIVLTYPGAQGIIQASWNWPFNRKDLEVYGDQGFVIAENRDETRVRVAKGEERRAKAPPLPTSQSNVLSYLMAVVRGEIKPEGLSSLSNNLVVTEILDAARRSAVSGQTIRLRS